MQFMIYNKIIYYIIIQIAEALIEKETLSYDDVEKLIGPPPHGKKNFVELADFVITNQTDELNTVNPTQT